MSTITGIVFFFFLEPDMDVTYLFFSTTDNSTSHHMTLHRITSPFKVSEPHLFFLPAQVQAHFIQVA